MSSIKGNQGLTRGRGFNPLNNLIWVLSRPVVCAVDSKIRELEKVDIQSMSDQSSVKCVVKKDWVDKLRTRGRPPFSNTSFEMGAQQNISRSTIFKINRAETFKCSAKETQREDC